MGKVSPEERQKLIDNSIVDSLRIQREKGRSLALLRAEIEDFWYEKRPDDEVTAEGNKFELVRSQGDLFSKQTLATYKPCPYRFKYTFRDQEGTHEGTCQDWEIGATYFKWSRTYGETEALDRIVTKFGTELPQKGMFLAMGTHSRRPDQ
ncbi:hypothetical protein [Pleomorphomonas sp. NRK KF1]|uniref:hypothetical protein n=1 Tax=Pleomorphomonas sp. NRK KF1 TaxID=2943000 RepID=UPI0020449751|nr:hypothetical protein [Pleomorphomonas sp. NRK KF1]MCM5555529.1 hypothetical protein [Pleomorphomonas sp. NRK KF1]